MSESVAYLKQIFGDDHVLLQDGIVRLHNDVLLKVGMSASGFRRQFAMIIGCSERQLEPVGYDCLVGVRQELLETSAALKELKLMAQMAAEQAAEERAQQDIIVQLPSETETVESTLSQQFGQKVQYVRNSGEYYYMIPQEVFPDTVETPHGATHPNLQQYAVALRKLLGLNHRSPLVALLHEPGANALTDAPIGIGILAETVDALFVNDKLEKISPQAISDHIASKPKYPDFEKYKRESRRER